FDDDIACLQPAGDAIVDIEAMTMIPLADDGCILINKNAECCLPENLTQKDFGNVETRILSKNSYNGTVFDENYGLFKTIRIYWFEKVRTQKPIMWNGEDLAKYGTSPIEIARSWVLDCSDGYLTIPVQSTWGDISGSHSISLIGGVNPDNHLEFELRHNSYGIEEGSNEEIIIAFDLNDILRNETPDKNGVVSIRLRWQSFSGEKTALFDIKPRDKQTSDRISVLK
ncbi:MAG: hypothetical protein K2J18_01290, partial [Paramuribaculum sp.]|nr:hypothetical protein [Paramuribaculum sp.]